MNIGKLVKQIKREAKANPGRTALLGMVLLVAVYFYAPLIFKWSGIGRAADTPAAVAAPQETPRSPAIAAEDAADFSWNQLVNSMQSDPRTDSADWPDEARDPFAPPAVALAEPVSLVVDSAPEPVGTEQGEEDAEPRWEPLIDGLQLQSILVGSRRSVVMINGETYRWEPDNPETAVVAVEQDGERVELRIVAVEPRSVVLAHGERRWTLKVPERGDSARIRRLGTE